MPPTVTRGDAENLSSALLTRLDALTKPRNSLGRLEELAHQLGMIQGVLRPTIECPHLVLFAGDHGVTAEGVSLYPQQVTTEMVRTFLAGGAASNVFARLHAVDVTVVNAGLASAFVPEGGMSPADSHARFVSVPLGLGTQNFAQGPAMRLDQVIDALAQGQKIVEDLRRRGSNTVLLGEMGIGNSSSAALILACLGGLPVHACVGRGTGLDDQGYAHKVAVLERAFTAFSGDRTNALDVARFFGGFEIVMMAGAYIAAAESRCIAVVDGFIGTAALLLAETLRPGVRTAAVFSHQSREKGHAHLLARMGARPLLDLDLALGEGTGALLALPLLRAACAMINEMATFATAGVSGAKDRT